MTKYLSLKQIKDMLPVGRQLKLIGNMVGPCDKARKVIKVKANVIIMENEEGVETYMFRDTTTKFEPTSFGFKVTREGKLLAEYSFV
jgi:hypothetical protein